MIGWTIIDTWIVLDIIIIAISATMIGLPLVLRKESLLGDGISHAVLPGIALGYIITGSRESVFMLVGAVVMGVLTALLTEYISHSRKIDESASLGVVFSGLFALGLLLMSTVASNVDLDPSCVLFGAVELTPLDTYVLAGFEIPRAIISNGAVMLLNIITIFVLFRKLHVSIFDSEFAKTLGIKVNVVRYIHIVLVALTTVLAFESVGSILIIALLVVPQAIGLVLSKRLKYVVLFSLIVTITSSILGHLVAIMVPPLFGYPDTNTVGSITVVMGVLFLLAVFFAPSGIISKKFHVFYTQYRITREDILKLLYTHHVNKIRVMDIRYLMKDAILTGRSSSMVLRFAKYYLMLSKYILYQESEYVCSDLGRRTAEHLLSKHRMWEDYLYTHVEYQADDVHYAAEQLEHIREKTLIEELKKQASPYSNIPGHTHGHSLNLRKKMQTESQKDLKD